MGQDKRVKELLSQFGNLLEEHLESSVGEFLTSNESVMELADELIELGYTGPFMFEPKMSFNLSSGSNEDEEDDTREEEEGSVQAETLPTKARSDTGPTVAITIGESEEDRAIADIFGLSSQDLAEMNAILEKAREDRRSPEPKPQPEQSTSAETESQAPLKEKRTQKRIRTAIIKRAGKMSQIFQRHIFAYSMNRSSAFTSLGIKFPDDNRIIMTLLDDKSWMERIEEAVDMIMRSDMTDSDKRTRLAYMEILLKTYSKW